MKFIGLRSMAAILFLFGTTMSVSAQHDGGGKQEEKQAAPQEHAQQPQRARQPAPQQQQRAPQPKPHLVDSWPSDWPGNWSDDDVYIDYDDGYHRYNRHYPRERLAITIEL